MAGACRVLRPRFYKSAVYGAVCDSKLLSESAREVIFDALYEAQVRGDIIFTVGFSHAPTIDIVGIKEANRLAMEEALRQIISHSSDVGVWIDGNDHYHFPTLVGGILEIREFIRGDARHKIIGCASIVAKVTRDRYMRGLAREYPLYGLDRHK